MFLISCKLYEHGGHTNVRDDVYILYFVILMEKISVSFEIHMRKFCMDLGHSHTHTLFENVFIWVVQIPGTGMPSWLGHEQLCLFNKSRCNQEQKRH
jgi:hypothetical protein